MFSLTITIEDPAVLAYVAKIADVMVNTDNTKGTTGLVDAHLWYLDSLGDAVNILQDDLDDDEIASIILKLRQCADKLEAIAKSE